MTPEEARAHYNFLLTLYIRKAESFGPRYHPGASE